jgi:outer membrane protein OmpA-like peptidoglycan-associated protein
LLSFAHDFCFHEGVLAMNHLNSYINNAAILLSILVAFIATGCASPPKVNPALERAKAAYQLVENNPGVQKNAAVAIYEAKRSLEKAETAQKKEDIDREAYRAERQVQIAVAIAELKMAEKQINDLTKENEKLLLERSRKETAQKAKEAEKARLEAERLKKEAEAKSFDAERARLEAEKAKEELAKLQKDLAELQAKQTDRGLVLTLRDVLFETGKAQLLPGAMRTIEKVSEFLIRNPQRNVLIEGHTDSVGGDEYNMTLSEQRANSVRSGLIDYEVPPNRITIKGYGKKYPVAGNDTASGRQQNRRVEIVILNEGVTAESLFR